MLRLRETILACSWGDIAERDTEGHVLEACGTLIGEHPSKSLSSQLKVRAYFQGTNLIKIERMLKWDFALFDDPWVFIFSSSSPPPLSLSLSSLYLSLSHLCLSVCLSCLSVCLSVTLTGHGRTSLWVRDGPHPVTLFNQQLFTLSQDCLVIAQIISKFFTANSNFV